MRGPDGGRGQRISREGDQNHALTRDQIQKGEQDPDPGDDLNVAHIQGTVLREDIVLAPSALIVPMTSSNSDRGLKKLYTLNLKMIPQIQNHWKDQSLLC